jgi:anti-sigma B factor antagonist
MFLSHRFGQEQLLISPRHLPLLRPPNDDIPRPLMAVELLELRGEIDLNEKPNVTARLDPLIEKQSPAIVVDLSGVSYIDSSGLAIFIDALQRIQHYGGKLALAGLRGNVAMVFQIARLDKVFLVFGDRQSAVNAFARP